ncbi:MAG: hypothetical protein ACI8WB_005825 [Phenylobacterium sp.]|jgi:hypothetical protein
MQNSVAVANIYKHFLLILGLLIALTAHGAKSTESVQLTEEFIEFKVGKSKRSHFFAVLMDQNENPYLDIDTVLNDWLEIPTSCKVERQYCQGTLYPSKTIFWIDAQQKQLGSNKADDAATDIAADDIAFIDNKIWLKYSSIADWLPVNISWTLYRYSLALTPNYLSLAQQKDQRTLNRKKHQLKQFALEKISQVPRLYPQNENPFEMRYNLNLDYKAQQQWQANASLQLLADIYQGTLQLNSSLKADKLTPAIDNYHYKYAGSRWFDLITIGNTHSFSNQLIAAKRLTNGLTLQTRKKTKGAGKFEYWDILRPDTEVDIFKNGILLDTINTDSSGHFHLPEQLASGGDVFTFAKYGPNGQTDTSQMKIAPDEALLQTPGSWDINAAAGEMDNGKLLQGIIRYGISDYLTIGTHLYWATFEPTENQLLNNTTDIISNTEENALSFDATMRLGGQSNLQYQYLQLDSLSKQAHYHALTLNVTAFEQQQLLINYFATDVTDPSDLPQLPRNIGSNSNNSRNAFTVDHRFHFNRWNIATQLSTMAQKTLLSQDFSKRLHRKLSFRGGYSLSRDNDNKLTFEAFIRSNLSLFNSKNMRVALNNDDKQLAIDASYRLNGARKNNRWDVNIQLNHPIGQSLRARLEASWHYQENAKLSFKTDGRTFGLQFSWFDAKASLKPDIDFKHFASGSVYGNITAPANNGNVPAPVAGFKIMAGNASGVTDNQGNFQIHGVPTDKDVLVKYDNNSLDVSYSLDREYDKVYLRPGTRVELSPKVISSVGIDGVVLSTDPLPLDIQLLISKQSDNSEVKTIMVESDGFFLTEKLIPGEYLLQVINVDNPPVAYLLTILDGADWIDGIEILLNAVPVVINESQAKSP